MPQLGLIAYQEDDGRVPFLDWLSSLSAKAQEKCRVRLRRLRDYGYELRRPETDYLRDGIYELRIRLGTTNYRILYFFHGRTAAVVSHGLVKERQVPDREIARALARKGRFDEAPGKHTHHLEIGDG